MNVTSPALKSPVLTRLLKASTPLTIALFAVTAITGAMLFFHLGGGPVKGIHEWLSMAFVVGSGLHTLKNWRPFQDQFRRWPLWVALGVTVLVVAAFLLAGGSPEGRRNGPGHREMSAPTQPR